MTRNERLLLDKIMKLEEVVDGLQKSIGHIKKNINELKAEKKAKR